MSNYTEECLKNFVNQTIKDIYNYLRQCNVHKLSWNTYAKIGIDNSTGANYSKLCFKRYFKHLTRLDIQKR